MAASERITRILIRAGSQPDQFLADYADDEFHSVRGLLLEIGVNYEVARDRIIYEDMPPVVFGFTGMTTT